MTILYVCAVRDSALEAFMPPIFVPATGLAVRSFSDEVNKPESPFYAHPADFELHLLGVYEDSTGLFDQAERRQLARGADVKQGG